MKKKLLILTVLVFGLLLALTVGVSASETEDMTALKITPGRTVSVTLPEGVGNYTYNEDIVILKGFSTNEEGETTLLFACKADIPMGTYDLLYINGESSMGISVYGMGDANMDGDVSARDVVLIKQAIVGMTELSGTQQVFSNVYDEDDEVNTRDAVLVLQHIVGMGVVLGTPDGDSAVCSGASLSIIDGYLYATYLDAPDTPINLGKVKGEDGIGITSIEKTGENGLVDTYTITYTDGNTTTFTVTNGAQGIQGIQGVPGQNGHTPVITIENGNWFVDGVDTGVAAQGPKGDTGDDGLSAFEIYQKYHPDYTGTEEEWIESLKGADGAQGEQGIGITDAYVDEHNHLWLVLSNGQKIDGGSVGIGLAQTLDGNEEDKAPSVKAVNDAFGRPIKNEEALLEASKETYFPVALGEVFVVETLDGSDFDNLTGLIYGRAVSQGTNLKYWSISTKRGNRIAYINDVADINYWTINNFTKQLRIYKPNENSVVEILKDLQANVGYDFIPNSVLISKYNGFVGRWYRRTVNGKDCMVTSASGSEIWLKVTGTETLTLKWEQMDSAYTPYYAYSIDGGDPIRKITTDQTISLPDTSQHTVRIIADGIKERIGKWTDGNGYAFAGVEVDVGGICIGFEPKRPVIAFYGDSITEGIRALGIASETATEDEVNSAVNSFPWFACEELGAVPYQVGFGGSGITNNGSFTTMINAIDYLSETRCMRLGEPYYTDFCPDYIVVNHGTNDKFIAEDAFALSYRETIAKLKSRYPKTPIFCMRPFGGFFADAIKQIADQTVDCYYIDTSDWEITYTDLYHPNADGARTAGVLLADAIKASGVLY